jgi:hypothetical protein
VRVGVPETDSVKPGVVVDVPVVGVVVGLVDE